MAKVHENLARLLEGLKRSREEADLWAQYIDTLSMWGGAFDIDARLRDRIFGGRYRVEGGVDGDVWSRMRDGFDELGLGRVIPISSYPADEHYISALDAVLDFEFARPVLRPPFRGLGPERDEELRNCDLVSRTLEHILRVADGSEEVVRRARISAMRYGVGGIGWGVRGDRVTIEFVPREAIWWSENERWLVIEREVFQSDEGSSEFDFDWDKVDPLQSFEYYEVWDLFERRTWYIDEHGKEVAAAKDWEAGMDRPPYAFMRLGRGEPYPLGLIQPWAALWEDLILINSVINYWTWRTNEYKLIAAGDVVLSKEDKEKIVSQVDDFVELPGSGDGSGVVLKEYRPRGPIDDWVRNFERLRNLLYELQHYPEISRGLRVPSNTKATTAVEMARSFDTFTARLLRSAREFLRDLYVTELDFLSYNITELAVTRGLDESVQGLLLRDYVVDVQVEDIRSTTAQQKAVKALEFAQFVAQNMQLGIYDPVKVIEYMHEARGLPPLSEFRAQTPPVEPQVPPVAGGGGVPSQPGMEVGLAQVLMRFGRDDLAAQVNALRLPPELEKGLVTRLMSDGEGFVEQLAETLAKPDPIPELVMLVSRSGVARSGVA